MNLREEWRNIPDHSGYQASTQGRIRSSRTTNGAGSKAVFEDGWRILTGAIGSRGYRKYTVVHDHMVKRTRNGHILVLEAFKGLRPPNLVARHLNDNKDDNRPDNLEWGTQLENMQDCHRNGKVYRGEAIPNSKLKTDGVKNIRHMHAEGFSLSAIARVSGVRPCTIRNVIMGKTWQHVE